MSPFEGDLGGSELQDVMQLLSHRSQTGILTIQGEGDIVAISFLNGEIVSADALNQTVEEGLGRVLLQQELVSEPELEEAIRQQETSGASLSDELVGADLLSREQLLQAMRLQTYTLLRRVLGWAQGEFKFYTGDEVAFEEGFAPISVDELLVRVLEDSPDAKGSALPNQKASYRRVAGEKAPRILGRDGDGTGEGLWLSEAEFLLYSRADGQRSAHAIAQAGGLSHYKAAYSLHRLLRLGLVEKLAEADDTASGMAPSSGVMQRPSSDVMQRPPSEVMQRPPSEVMQRPPSEVMQRPPAELLALEESSGSSPQSSTSLQRPELGGNQVDAGDESAPTARKNELPTLSNIALFPSEAEVAEPSLAPGTESTPAARGRLDLDASGFDLPDLDASGLGMRAEAGGVVETGLWHGWLAGALGALMALSALWVFLERPIFLAFPGQWQEAQRGALERQVRRSQYLRIDRAARTFFLMDAHFPDALGELVGQGLLSSKDLRGVSGRLLSYSGEDVIYRIGSAAAGDASERIETIEGDFHLDSNLAPSSPANQAPLYLID